MTHRPLRPWMTPFGERVDETSLRAQLRHQVNLVAPGYRMVARDPSPTRPSMTPFGERVDETSLRAQVRHQVNLVAPGYRIVARDPSLTRPSMTLSGACPTNELAGTEQRRRSGRRLWRMRDRSREAAEAFFSRGDGGKEHGPCSLDPLSAQETSPPGTGTGCDGSRDGYGRAVHGRQGLRLHQARRRRQGRVRAPLGDRGLRLPVARAGRTGGVRPGAGPRGVRARRTSGRSKTEGRRKNGGNGAGRRSLRFHRGAARRYGRSRVPSLVS